MNSSEDAGAGRGEGGFSILEVAIALAILLTVLVSVSSLMVTAFKVGANSRFRQSATEIATSTLDAQVQTGATTLLGDVGDTALPSVTSAGQTYLAELEVTPFQPNSSGCQSPQGNGEAMLKVTVWVTWADEPSGATWWIAGSSSATGLLVEETTQLAVPGTDLNPLQGTILVTVTNAAGNGVQGVAVTATSGGTTLTATTTSSGCALFTNIATGTWTVTGSKASYIDNFDDWSTATNSPATLSSGSITVQAATTTTVSWNYDFSTVTPSYTVTLAGASPWLPTNISSVPLTFYSSYFPSGSGISSYEATSPADVYPYPATGSPAVPSYYVVAGTCGVESAPDGASLAGATTDGQPVTLTSGASVSPAFALTPIDLVVTHSGAAVSNATVTAAVASSDANCATGILAMPTLGLGTTCVPGVACAVNAAYRGKSHGRHPDAILVSYNTSTSISSTLNPSTYGSSVTFTAIVTRTTGTGTPNGTVTFTNGGSNICSNVSFGSTTSSTGTATCTTSSMAVASGVTIQAQYNPGYGFNSSSATLSQTINKAPTTTTLISNPNPNSYGTSALLTATVTANSPSTATPTGTVNFTSGGTTISGCGSVALSSGHATCTLSGVNGGTYSLAAIYTPSTSPTNFVTSTSSTLTQTISAASTTTTLTSSSSQNASTSGSAVTFTATVAATSGGPATGTITFQADGAAIADCSTPVALVSQAATCTTSALAVGSHTITAVYNPTNSNNLATSTGTLTQTVFSTTPPSIISGLPYGVWVITASYVTGGTTYTASITVTVTPGHTQVGASNLTAGSQIVLSD